MNFHPQEGPSIKPPNLGSSTLQIEDLNSLIDSLKRREENTIQLMDYNLKFKSSTNHLDVVHLRSLYIQLTEKEKRRAEQERQILVKYSHLQVSDDYQKKLLNKMKNKIIQLNISAKDKLVQLGISTQLQQTSSSIPPLEESLEAILAKTPVDVKTFLNFVVEISQKKFFKEIDDSPEERAESPEPNPPSTKAQESNTVSPADSVRELLHKKSFTSRPTEEIKSRETPKSRNFESKGFSTRKEIIIKPGNPLKVVDSRPSFDVNNEDTRNGDMSTSISRGGNVNHAKELGGLTGTSTPGEMIEVNLVKVAQIREIQLRQEVNVCNVSTPNGDKSMSLVSSVSNSVKKVKVSASINNKKSVCLEETTEVQLKEKDVKVNKDAWLKNYDILKIDYQPLPVASKKETKKLLLEKVYNQLLGTNTDIKRTIKYYKTSYLSFSAKKESELKVAKEGSTSFTAAETSRPKSLHIQSSLLATPTKPKVVNVNHNQRHLLSMENMKDIVHQGMSTEAFMNAVNPFYSNKKDLASKQIKENTQRKQSSQKFLILPKLNINNESQSQLHGVFPSWPSSLQGSKSMGKPQFPLEFASRPRYDKNTNKTSERVLQNLVIETKQESINFEIVNSNPLKGNRAYLNFSKKNYPLGLQNIDVMSSLHKALGF